MSQWLDLVEFLKKIDNYLIVQAGVWMPNLAYHLIDKSTTEPLNCLERLQHQFVHEMGSYEASGADFWCKMHCASNPVDLDGFRCLRGSKNDRKSTKTEKHKDPAQSSGGPVSRP